MSGEHYQQQQQPYRGMPLPSLSSAAPSTSPHDLPHRLPSLARLSSPPRMYYRHSHSHSHHEASASSSAESSPSSSPRIDPNAAVRGVKRMRISHSTHASVHPTEHAATLVHAQRRANRSEEDVFISGAYKSQRKPAQNATHELRTLRQDAATMEYQFQVLRTRWKKALPERRVLLRACEAAKSKWVTSQAEELNRQLKEQLLQQQLYLASLQSLVLQSPFLDQSRSREIFEAIHTPLRLDKGLSSAQRCEKLHNHCNVSIRIAPAITNRFLRPHASKASVETPFSHTSIMSDGDFTFASNLLICRIPHASLPSVADAVATYFATLHHELQSHIGLSGGFTILEHLTDINHYAQFRYENGSELTSVMNTTFASHVSADRAIFVTDFVDDDAVFPARAPGDGSVMRDMSLALVLAPTVDEVSGQRQILLQRVAVTRYNLPPNSRAVHHDVKSTQQWFNGDLLLKVICQQLEQQQAEARS